jgi:3D (Asp-Asp-Asp) domain-containing protein
MLKLATAAFLANVLQIAVATAPVTPILGTPEAVTAVTSLSAKSPTEREFRTVSVKVTCYSSTPDQTDDSPFITASNKHVREGIIAANKLPFGTKVQFPELYGDQVFVVEDRMHSRFNDRMDIWMPDRASAQACGLTRTTAVVLES